MLAYCGSYVEAVILHRSFLYAEVSFLCRTAVYLKTHLLSILYVLHRSKKIYEETQ